MPEAQALAANEHRYRLNFKPETLLAGLESVLIRTNDPKPGDVLAIVIEPHKTDLPRHLAMLTSERLMVHCYGLGQIKQVVEVPVGRSRPIHSYWTWPSLEGR